MHILSRLEFMLALKAMGEKRGPAWLPQPLHRLPFALQEGSVQAGTEGTLPEPFRYKEGSLCSKDGTSGKKFVFPPLFKCHSLRVTTLGVPLHWGMITLQMPRDVLKQEDTENPKDTSTLPGAPCACRKCELCVHCPCNYCWRLH